MKIRLGTRASGLARAQSGVVVDRLHELAEARGIDLEVTVVPVTAEGEPGAQDGLAAHAMFVAALRVAVLSGECDLVVHSMTDLPVEQPDGLLLAAVPARWDARDALCTGGPMLTDLPLGARVGTNSLRRRAQLLALRPDLTIVDIAGDIGMRLEKLSGGDVEALVLAQAELEWIGRPHAAVQILDPSLMVPAPGQGSLAVEMRRNVSADIRELVAELDDPATRAVTAAERAAQLLLDPASTGPMAAHAVFDGSHVELHVRVLNPGGTLTLNEYSDGTPVEAVGIGRQAALLLIGRGARPLMGVPA